MGERAFPSFQRALFFHFSPLLMATAPFQRDRRGRTGRAPQLKRFRVYSAQNLAAARIIAANPTRYSNDSLPAQWARLVLAKYSETKDDTAQAQQGR
jgi:hypothetical protein